MKSLAISSILALSVLATAQAPHRLYGKTRPQALAMGQQKWMDFTADKKDGSSTAGMVRAMDFFAAAAQDRNDRLIDKLPRARSVILRSIRTALTGAGTQIISTESNSAGGGSMYHLFYPARVADIELDLYSILKPNKEVKVPDLVTGNAMRELRDNWKARMAKSDSPDDKEALPGAIQKADEAVTGALGKINDLGDENGIRILRSLVASWLTPEKMDGGS